MSRYAIFSDAGRVGRGGAVLFFVSLGLVTCTEYTYNTQTQTDIFQQVRRNTVDVLLVVDNSGSMIEEQSKLASNFEAFISHFEGIDVDWQIAVITTDTVQEDHRGRFRGGDDEIELVSAAGISIDRVAWDRTWEVPRGASMQLDPAYTAATSNDNASAWCPSSAVYNVTDQGSPGDPNTTCAARAPFPLDTGDTGDTGEPEDTGTPAGEGRAPARAGEVLITEFMADPADLTDAVGEWVELTSMVDDDLDLAGCVLQDDGRNAFTLPEDTLLPARGRLVLARTADAGFPVDVVMGDDFTLNDDVLVITPETEGPSEIFSEMVAVGITGSGIEMGFEALHMAFSDEDALAYNPAFLREEASLSIIVLSDENDSSPYAVDDYLRFLTELKGEEAYRDHGLMNISAVVGSEMPEFDGEPSCSSDNGDAEYGTRYIKAVERTEGLLDSICEEDFSPIAAQLGLTVSGLEVEFELSEACDENTLVVSLYETAEDDGFLGDLIKDEDYSFVVERNAIRFEDEQIPPSEYYIMATYRVLATGATAGTPEEPGDTGGLDAAGGQR